MLETFKPFSNDAVKVYVCGITPYDTTHLGHAFTYIFFDTLVRYLAYKGFKVSYTQNVTDINDRDNDLLKRAKNLGVHWTSLANYWTDKFLHDMHSLNWIMPDNFMFASAHIPAMLKIINQLKSNDLTYEVNGAVYLEIKKFKDFGKLSRLDEYQMLAYAKEFEEDTDNPDKKHPLDVTLWKPTSPNEPPHIPSFDSPFGPGRPGWHLECSAMGVCSLGEQIDIHGGGVDLLYPHHESEIAQSEGATGKKPFAKYWLHTQLVSFMNQKMSKSIGNLVLVSDLLENYSANAIRYVLLSHHYRKQWEFYEDELRAAEIEVTKIKNAIHLKTSKAHHHVVKEYLREFCKLMDNDMNTPAALEYLQALTRKQEVERSVGLKHALLKIVSVLGLSF